MRRLVLALAVLSSAGCAGNDLAKTAHAAEVALVGLDVAIEQAAPVWGAYVEAQVAHCRAQDLTTKAEGRACLGPAAQAKDVREVLEAVTKAQAAALEALEALKRIAPLLEQAEDRTP